MNDYKVLITTSGTGSRLGELTKAVNKALVTVGEKTVIEHIVDAYSKETRFVVTIGYYGEQVRNFLMAAYPDRTFEFIEVDKYTGDGSSLGYSMLCAKDALQCPFIFHCNDTLVEGEIPPPTKNWIGTYEDGDVVQYTSWKVTSDGKLLFQAKGAVDFDYIHIGLIGVCEYAAYWRILEELYAENSADQSLNDCKVLVRMLVEGRRFSIQNFATWYDTGNLAALEAARQALTK